MSDNFLGFKGLQISFLQLIPSVWFESFRASHLETFFSIIFIFLEIQN